MPKPNKSDKQIFLKHAKTHYFWNNPGKTGLSRTQVKAEHARLVKLILKRGFNHNSPLK